MFTPKYFCYIYSLYEVKTAAKKWWRIWSHLVLENITIFRTLFFFFPFVYQYVEDVYCPDKITVRVHCTWYTVYGTLYMYTVHGRYD